MANPLQPNQNDPWAWNQWAQTQDPGLYGWKQNQIQPYDLSSHIAELQAAGKWTPQLEQYVQQLQQSAGNGDSGIAPAAPDMSELDGWNLGTARSTGNSQLNTLFSPDGQQYNGGVDSMSNSLKGNDYAAMAAIAGGVFGAGALGLGAGAEGIGTLGTIAPGAAESGALGYSGQFAMPEFGALSAPSATLAGETAALGAGQVGAMGGGGIGVLGSGSSIGSTGLGSSALGTTGAAASVPSFAPLASTIGAPEAGGFLSGMSTGNWLQLGAGALGYLGNQQAIKAGTDATNQANNLQRDIFNQQTAQNQPLIDTRNSALGKINALLADPSSITKEPGYQFGLDQGQKQLNNNAAATGTYYSGGQQKAAARYNQDYASTKLNDTYNRLAGVAGLGQTGATNQSNALMNYGNTVGQNTTNLGNFRGSGYINGTNQIGNALGGIANDWQTQQYLQNLRKGP